MVTTLGAAWRRLVKLSRRMWVRASLFSIAGVALAIFAVIFEPYVPYDLTLKLASGSVASLLNIVATSMLAVTTFSLGIIRTSYTSAATNATPRANQLLTDDTVAQNTLGTFVGSFLFSIVGIIGLSSGFYNDNSRIILFVATLVVIFLIVLRLLRWIDVLTSFGRLSDTIRRLEDRSCEIAGLWFERPALGCVPVAGQPQGDAVYPQGIGHVGHIDFGALQELAEERDGHVTLLIQPGSFVSPDEAMARVTGARPDTAEEPDRMATRVAACVTIEPTRSFHEDPYFGPLALSEVASRALSPAVNDPGTGVQVVESGLRIFHRLFAERTGDEAPPEPRYDRVAMADVDADRVLRLFFDPIARDGAALVEVQVAIQKALSTIVATARPEAADAARSVARLARQRALAAMDHPDDRARVERCTPD